MKQRPGGEQKPTIEQLRAQLAAAVKEERYEVAKRLRDEILRREGKAPYVAPPPKSRQRGVPSPKRGP